MKIVERILVERIFSISIQGATMQLSPPTIGLYIELEGFDSEC